MAEGAVRSAPVIRSVGVTRQALAPHGVRAVGYMAAITVFVGGDGVEPTAGALMAC